MGSEAARALLEHGALKIALFDTNLSLGQQTTLGLKGRFPHADVLFKQLDVTDADAVNAAVHEVAEAFGKIDILLTFAGIVECEHALEMSVQAWQRVLDVNLTGSFLCAQAVARYECGNNEEIYPVLFLLPFPGSEKH